MREYLTFDVVVVVVVIADGCDAAAVCDHFEWGPVVREFIRVKSRNIFSRFFSAQRRNSGRIKNVGQVKVSSNF